MRLRFAARPRWQDHAKACLVLSAAAARACVIVKAASFVFPAWAMRDGAPTPSIVDFAPAAFISFAMMGPDSLPSRGRHHFMLLIAHRHLVTSPYRL